MGIAIGFAAGVLGLVGCGIFHWWSAKQTVIGLAEENVNSAKEEDWSKDRG